MNKVVLLTGGNLGNRMASLQEAKKAIELRVGKLISESIIVESEPWGFESENAFLNQVLIVETRLSAENILEVIQQIEIDLGRVRKKEQWISRIIDIDILFFNDEIIRSERLTIPHKHIQDRRFTLYAMNTIAPFFNHPVFNQAIQELLHRCEDQSEVEVYFE